MGVVKRCNDQNTRNSPFDYSLLFSLCYKNVSNEKSLLPLLLLLPSPSVYIVHCLQCLCEEYTTIASITFFLYQPNVPNIYTDAHIHTHIHDVCRSVQCTP